MSAILNYLRHTKQHKGRRHMKKKDVQKYIKVPKTLVVICVYKNRLHNSRPCDHCIRIMRSYGVKKVIYSTGLQNPNEMFYVEDVDTMDLHGPSSGNRGFY